MNKLAIQETFPPGIVGREIVLAQMCHHYRRISSAKARVDTNLFKPPKINLSRPLSAEVASVVQRCLSPRSPPKHRRCLKYEHEMGEHHIKPSVRSQTAESRLRATPEVYHPAVKPTKPQHQEFDGQQQGTQTSLENSLAEEDEEPKTRDEAVQTVPPGLYRPLEARSVQFLRDVTNDALHRRAFTSSALNRIFLDHQFRNTYGLSQELMERELEELRRQLGMLPKHRSEGSTVSDAEALDALDCLVLDPRMKEEVIRSLRLSRANEAKKPTYSYFDRLKFDEDEPMRDRTCKKLRETLRAVENFGTANGNIDQVDQIPLDDAQSDRIEAVNNLETEPGVDGWNAEIEEEDREATTASSTRDDVDTESDSEEEVAESVADSDEKQSIGSGADSNSESDGEIDEVTQRESTSKPITDEQSESKIEDGASKLGEKPHQTDISKQHSTNISATAEDTNSEVAQSLLTPLKLESASAKGDKWRSSLEVVKEESDSTTGQVSDISTASTPSEGYSKRDNSRELSSTATRSNDAHGQSSAAYRTAESGEPIQQQGETERTGGTASASLSKTEQDASSSTGGEIVRQMDDLLAGHGNGNSDLTIPQTGDVSEDQKGAQPKDVDEDKSDAGSEVESVHTDTEDDDSHSQSGSESEMESVHTD